MDRNSNSNLANCVTKVNEFLLSPYKISLAVLIQEFNNFRSKHSQREIGKFCILIMKLIHSFDLSYNKFLSTLKTDLKLKQCSISEKVEKKIDEMNKKGVCSLHDLVNEIKNIEWISKTSFLGIFVRRFQLYFDKLSFNGVMGLYDEFKKYVSEKEILEIVIDDVDNFNFETSNCPKQTQNFINKQLNMLQINEKKALSPQQLNNLIDYYEEQNKFKTSHLVFSTNDFFRKRSSSNEINFLNYINAIRVNEYVKAKHALFAYFDGISNSGSRCWPALNLAMFYYHFKHYNLSIDSLKECVSSAQDANDEKCLEYALIWIATIIIEKRDKSYSEEDILAILHHLQIKATKLELHNLASIASLNYEKLTGLHSKNRSSFGYSQGNILNADLVAVKNSLNDILMKTYSCKSAHFYQIGAINLAALTSQALLHLHAVELVGDEFVSYVNENTAIALRNMALHIWKNIGEYELAREILTKLSERYFSNHNKEILSIWKSALYEIDYEHYLYRNEWSKAETAIEALKLFDLLNGKLNEAEFELKRGDKKKAFKLVNELLTEDEENKKMTPYFRIKVLLLKAKILDNISSLFEPLNLAIVYQLKGLESLILIELCFQLNKIGQLTQSLKLLRNQMIFILENLTQKDIAKAYYLTALNLRSILHRSDHNEEKLHLSKHEFANQIKLIIDNNQKAIDILKKIQHFDLLKLSYKMHAELYNDMNELKQRNFYAKELRLLLTNS